MTKEEIHNIYLHMSGKAEGIAEATGSADFPVLFANAILEYTKRPWVDLTDGDWEWVADKKETSLDTFAHGAAWAADQLKERNNG